MQIPFKDNSFNIVFCANLLHHINTPAEVISEMNRVSSRFVVIIEPNRYNPFMMMVAFLSKEDRLVLKYTSSFLNSLLTKEFKNIWQSTSGFILPNKTPVRLLSLCKKLEPYLYPKMYNILIAEKK